MIPFKCDCGKQLQAQDHYAGQQTACPACGKVLTIPPPQAVQAEAPLPAAALPDEPGERVREGRPRRRFADDDRGPPPGPQQTSGKAVTSLVCGLLSFCLPLVLPNLLAVILGFMGLADIRRSRGRVGGSGLAITGIVTGILSLVLLVPALLIALLLPAVSSVRTAAARAESQNNLKQLALGCIMYEADHKRFPPAVVYSRDGQPLYSWRVLILPYVEQNDLFQQFKLDEPWDSAHNIQFVKRMPRLFHHPSGPPADQGLTHYQVFRSSGMDDGRGRAIFRGDRINAHPLSLGPPGLLTGSDSLNISRVSDGLSNTILVAEAADPVPWTSPQDMDFRRDGPLPRLPDVFGGRCNVVFGDGVVRGIDPRRIPDDVLRGMITANGGEVVRDGDW
jgi:hypothetical protein